MALTSFCHLHILFHAKQKVYKPYGYVIERFILFFLSPSILIFWFLDFSL
uniref:Uncharacterized protein n=1 Tax=Rhizophora mucronata TaxID=61149 RepID=A0A2P2K0T2_RHIMU